MDVQSSLNIVRSSSSSPSSATVPVLTPNPPSSLPVHPPTSEEIDAVIQQATSAVSSDGRHVPLKDTRTQLFVGNLPYRVRWQDLKDLFRKAGTVLRADVSLGPDNRSRGHGTVLLATAEDAGRAVDMFNGYSWQSRVLEVRLDRLPSDFDNFSNPTVGYHILAPISSHAPVITGLRPPHSFSSTLPPSISPLPSTSLAPQIPLRSALDDSSPDHFMIFGHDRPATAGGISRNLFVGNLPFHCQWQDLKDLFRQAGTILRADVALGQDGRSRGFGTVVFATEHDAERAVNMFNGYEYNGRLLKVHYDKFMPSVGQSLTAPSSPSLTSPFLGVNVASYTSMANVSARPTSSRSNPLPPLPPQSLDYTAYYLSQVKSSSSPPPLNALPSLPRSQPQGALPRVGATPEHQLLAHLSTSLGLSDPMHTNNSILRKESPSIGLSDLPTPPSSSAGISSTKGSRMSTPPLHIPQPLPKQEFPPPQHHAVGNPFAFTASASLTHPEPSHSFSMPISSSQREVSESLEQASPPSRQRAHTHPAHPGPISIPPPSAFVPPPAHTLSPVSPIFVPGTHISPSHKPGVPIHSPLAHPHSPLHHPMYSHTRPPHLHPAHTPSLTLNMTPSGLPPITPSMPSFQFVPGPPTLSQSNHPAIAFSPASTMSPGAFWGRPGGNTLTNAAVGAPVTKGQSGEEVDYFSGAGTDAGEGEGYFPPLPQTGSTLSKEILLEDSVGEREAALALAMENGVDQEVSTSNGSSGRASVKERASGSGVDEVIEETRRSLNISHAENTRRTEEQDHSHSKSLPPFKDTDRAALWSGERVSARSCTTRAQSN